MKGFFFVFCLLAASLLSTLKSQNVLNAYHYATIEKENLDYIPGLTPQYDVRAYYILYSTVDSQGDSTVASGMCFIPDTDSCDFFPLISYQHGTILKKSDVPSRLNGESLIGQIFCSMGNICLCPDYIGLGDSPGLHPYCHGESEATAVVDFIRAARSMIADSLLIHDNSQVFLTGYSQGGHATMAAHKYIEENNLMSEINVVASAPCSGPYHISGAQSEMIFNTPDYPSPGYLIYILFAYDLVYDNIFDVPAEVLQSPYDVTIPPYLNGNYSTSQLNNALPDSLHLFLADSFYQQVIDDMDDKLLPFWQNLIDNDNHDWIPQTPVRMYYCSGDEQVSYMNSVNADSAMNANGAPDVQSVDVYPPYGHGDCGLPAIVNAYYWFETKMIPCQSQASLEEPEIVQPEIYPNPAGDVIYIHWNHHCIVQCFDLQGKLCYAAAVSESDRSVNVSHWLPGIYILKVIDVEMSGREFYYKVLIIKD
jgi:hypothetical protein